LPNSVTAATAWSRADLDVYLRHPEGNTLTGCHVGLLPGAHLGEGSGCFPGEPVNIAQRRASSGQDVFERAHEESRGGETEGAGDDEQEPQ
jgi:hypothetical protein